MTVSYGTKAQQRRSVLSLWVPYRPTKPVAFSGETDQSPSDSPGSDSPTSDPSSTSVTGKGFLRTRLTRSGSKLLSLLGLGSPSSGNKTSAESRSYGDDHSDESSRSPSVPSTEQSTPYPPDDCHGEDGSPDSAFEVQPQSSNSVHGSQEAGEVADTDKQQGVLEGVKDHDAIQTEQEGASSLKLVDRFSRKFSTTFGQPTVIRRARLRTRPSLHFISTPASSTSHNNGDGADDSSDPSTSSSSGGSPVGHSTSSTPATSAEPQSPSSDRSIISPSELSCSPKQSSVVHTSAVGRSPTIAPSIVTVEAASAAKIYFELYFNSLFQHPDTRSRRQHELEQHIYTFQLSPEEQLETRRNWILQENEYLRQCRALKTRLRRTQTENATSIAGYEVVKTLGKGSFGLVQLVREKPSGQTASPESALPSRERNPLRTRSKSLGMLRSAMDGTSHVRRRRIMAGKRKEVYAMKVIRKSVMIRNCQEGHIRAERDFLVCSEKSRWVVPLVASFQDDANLYLVMDYMVGGDFLGLLLCEDILSEDWTVFYIAEMILCIEEAHRLGWIHRDIKPDNFLISASGHLKISDFGLAFNGHWAYNQVYYSNHRYSVLETLGISVKGDAEDQKQAVEAGKAPTPDLHLHWMNDIARHHTPSTDVLKWRDSKDRRRYAKSVVGTSQYMAPEVIRGEMYDGRCDWWSLGIILYECLYGFTPFARKERQDTKICILYHSKTLRFPRETRSDKLVSREAIDLISRIVQEREYRLCSDKYRANDLLAGRLVSKRFLYSIDPRYLNVASCYVYPDDATDIKTHPFFRGVPWDELHLIQPPMIPRVRGWEDTRYFADLKDILKAAEAEAEAEAEPGRDGNHDTGPNVTTKEILDSDSSPAKASASNAPPDVTGKPDAQQASNTKKKKEERPRDKILRDQQLGQTALEIRKKGAFLGYTYRRPKGPAMALSAEGGRQPFTRGQLDDLYTA